MWFDVIATARPELTDISERYGYLTGSRLDNLPPYESKGIDVDFIDMNWKNPRPKELIAACRRHNPKYAVAGDYDESGSSVDTVNERSQILLDHADNVIVVPKRSGEVEKVPPNCIVGYSVPTEYGGTKANIDEYRGRDIHLLGGTPHKQITLTDRFGDDVVSIDGNSYLKAATIGNKYWTKDPPRWKLVKWTKEDRVKLAYENSVLHTSYAFRELSSSDRQSFIGEFI